MYDDLVEIDCWMHLQCVLVKRMIKRCVSTQDPFMDCENFGTMSTRMMHTFLVKKFEKNLLTFTWKAIKTNLCDHNCIYCWFEFGFCGLLPLKEIDNTFAKELEMV
jgi:hypothetical protein